MRSKVESLDKMQLLWLTDDSCGGIENKLQYMYSTKMTNLLQMQIDLIAHMEHDKVSLLVVQLILRLSMAYDI